MSNNTANGKFQKGNQFAKLKGKHKKTLAWENLGDFFTKAGAERAVQIMLGSNDPDFMKYYFTGLEYFKPKQQRTELKADDINILRPVIVLPPVAEKPQALPNPEQQQ